MQMARRSFAAADHLRDDGDAAVDAVYGGGNDDDVKLELDLQWPPGEPPLLAPTKTRVSAAGGRCRRGLRIVSLTASKALLFGVLAFAIAVGFYAGIRLMYAWFPAHPVSVDVHTHWPTWSSSSSSSGGSTTSWWPFGPKPPSSSSLAEVVVVATGASLN